MRCSDKVTIFHLKKFLARKLQVPATYEVSQFLKLVPMYWYVTLSFSWNYYAWSQYFIKTTAFDLYGYPIG